MRTWCPELHAQRLGVRDCVSSSLNTQPLQPDVQLRQRLELVYQIIVFTNWLVLFPQLFHFLITVLSDCSYLCLKTLTEDFLNFLISISSVCLSSFCVILCLRFLYSVFSISFHHVDYAVALVCLYMSTYSATSSSSLRNFLTLKFLSEELIKIAYSHPL